MYLSYYYYYYCSKEEELAMHVAADEEHGAVVYFHFDVVTWTYLRLRLHLSQHYLIHYYYGIIY